MTTVPPTADGPATQTDEDVPVIRRRTQRMFVPREKDTKDVGAVVTRGILEARASRKPETSRSRKVAGHLPAWEPLPPDELTVRRPSTG